MARKNLELLYQEIDKTKLQTTERFRNIDNKLNFLLVFNVGVLVIIQFLIPQNTNSCFISYLQYTLLIINLSLNLTTFIMLFKGLYMRSIMQYEVKDFNINDMKNCEYDKLLESFINKNKEIIDVCEKQIHKKQIFYKSANVIIIIHMVISFVGIIFNYIL